MVWVQTICKDYQHTTKNAANSQRVNIPVLLISNKIVFMLHISGLRVTCLT